MQPEDATFIGYRQFNAPELRRHARLRRRLGDVANEAFPSQMLPDRFARALASRHAVVVKELLEAFEFYARVRHRVRRAHMVDLCSGHGLVGVFFAMLERGVERVSLVDCARPEIAGRVLAAAVEVAPWVAQKIDYQECRIEDAELPDGAGLVAVHACGRVSDLIIDRAIQRAPAARGPVAVLPCCHSKGSIAPPRGLVDALGRALAVDIHRSYRLEGAGFQVTWSAIPKVVTPLNRVLLGLPRDRA